MSKQVLSRKAALRAVWTTRQGANRADLRDSGGTQSEKSLDFSDWAKRRGGERRSDENFSEGTRVPG